MYNIVIEAARDDGVVMRCIIKNALLLMWHDCRFILEKHDVIIDDHLIIGLDVQANVDTVYDYKDRILLPAFFNIHCHLGEYYFKNLCKEKSTITNYLRSTEEYNNSLSLSAQEERWISSARLTIEELLRNGIIGLAAGRSAIPCRIYSMFNMCGYPLMQSEKLKKFIPDINSFKAFKRQNESKYCNVGILLHSMYATDFHMLNFARLAMEQESCFFTAHISEDRETREIEEKKYKAPPINVLQDYNLLSKKAILVHCGFASNEELRILAEQRCIIAVCPISNYALSSRMPNLDLLERLSIDWCISTDGPATGKSLSLTKQIAQAKKEYPNIANESFFLSITQRPAAVFNCPYYTGKIEVGTVAVFNIIDNYYNDANDLLNDLVLDSVPYRICRF